MYNDSCHLSLSVAATYFDLLLAIPIFYVQAAEEYNSCGLLMPSCSCSDWEHIGKKRDTERMNHEDGADAWGSQRPETPPWNASEYSQLISAGPLLPLLEQYAGVGMMRDNKRREQLPSSQRWRWHSTYVIHCHFFAGSYDQNTHRGAPWQVQSQGANTDKCTGSQLQLASMANQGNAKRKKRTCCCGREKWTCKKTGKRTHELSRVKMQSLHAARGIRQHPCTCHRRHTQVSP